MTQVHRYLLLTRWCATIQGGSSVAVCRLCAAGPLGKDGSDGSKR
jgi:hypothetical protein